MKKVFLFAFAFVMMFSFSSKAQGTDAGNNYVKLQFVQPIGEYSDFYNSGFGAEFGRMFPLDIDIVDGLILPGLDITFLSTSFNTGKDHDYDLYRPNYNGSKKDSLVSGQSQGGLLWKLGVKIGPMITVGITDGLVADFAIQYDPTVVFSMARKGFDPDKWGSGYIIDDKASTSTSFSHQLGIKADIRYSHFLFGLEFTFGLTTFHYGKDIVPVEGTTPTILTDERDMGLNTLLLNFGFTF